MAVSAKLFTLAALSLLLMNEARAQQTQVAAAPADRCEGTLCDLYYATRGNAPDAGAAKPAATPTATTPGVPAGATVLTAPSGNPLGRLFGGGGNSGSGSGGSSWFGGGSGTRTPAPESEPAVATNSYMHMGTGGLLGGNAERCSGTLCDFYYGSSPKDPTPTQRQAAVAGGYVPVAASSAPTIPHRHIVHESETRPKCSSPSADPWHCFR